MWHIICWKSSYTMRKFIKILFIFTILHLFVSENFASNEPSNISFDTESSNYSNTNNLVTSITASKTAVCKGDAQPTVTFSITSGGTSPYTFFYTKNGISNKISTSVNSNTASISIETNIATSITVTLDSVSYGALPAEKQTNKKLTITVEELPLVDFTFDNNNECSGTEVTFTPKITNPDNYTYSWDFGDGTTSNLANPSHRFYLIGTGNQNFTIKLTVTNKTTGCVNSKTGTITVKKGGDTNITSNADLKDYNGFKTFLICNSSTQNFIFNNASTTLDTNTSYEIDWGDNSEIFSASTWTTKTHSYNPGLWSLKYTVSTGGGCNVTMIYKVFVGSNPSISLGNPGNTDVCSDSPLKFPITGTENNPPGTTYTVTFNDGSNPIVFNHPAPTEVIHTFLKTSCGATSNDGSNFYPNSFSVNIVAENPCGKSSVNVMPIYVSTPSKAEMQPSKTIGCVNEQLTISYPHSEHTLAGPSGCIGSKVVWSITPNSGFILNSGIFGNDFGSNNYNMWLSGSNVIYPTFTTPGTYIVKMRIGNKCNLDETTDTICITAPPAPTFTVDKTTGCFPLTVNTNNTTDENKNCNNVISYKWEIVAYSKGTCGTAKSYTMTDGANTITNGSSSSKNTNIIFNNPGIYTLRLSATNNCGTYYSTNLQTITVKAPPNITINSITDVCQILTGNLVSPTAQVVNCGVDNLNYEWSFPGGNPSTSSYNIPGDIIYSIPGTYTTTLKVTNECGVSTTATRTFTIKPTPILTSTSVNQFKCAGQLSDLVHFTSDLPNTIFRWTNNNTQIGLPASGTGDILSSTLTNTTNANITGTITVTPTLNGCNGASQTFDITVKPTVYFTSQPVSSAVCLNGIAQTLSVTYANGTGIPQYQWYSNTTNSNSGGSIISGANASTFDPPTNTVGTVYYYCILTLPADVCGTITSNVATVAVSPIPTIDAQPLATQQLCVGGVINSLSVSTINGAGTPTYQWYSNTSNSNVGGTMISGANSINYTPPAFNSIGSYYYYVVVTYSASACGIVTSNVAEVLVVSDPIVTSQPLASQTLCQNSTSTPLSVVASGGLGTYNYQWYVNSSNSTVGGFVILGANTDTYTPPTSVVGTFYYYCLITQSGLGCAVTSNTSEVVINISPSFVTQPQSSTICLGTTISPLSVTYRDGIGTASYQWYSNTIDNNTSGTAISGEINSTFSPPLSIPGTTYYYCVVNFSLGGCKTIISNTANITINQYPIITNYTAHIGSGTSFNITPSTIIHPTDIIPTGTTYTWSNPLISPSGAIIGSSSELSPQTSISQLLNNITTTSATATYTVTPSANGCNGNTFQIVVTVDPPIKVDTNVTNATCFGINNGSININISGGTPPYTVLWNGPSSFTSNTTNISGLAPGIYSLEITDSFGIIYTNNYTVTEPADIIFTSTVKKDITCNGANDGEISLSISGRTTPYKYNWTKDGNPFATSKDITNLQPGNYDVFISDLNNCGPITASFTIVEPAPIIITLNSKTDLLCFGDSVGQISVDISGGTLKEKSPGVFDYDYLWTGPGGFVSNSKNVSNLKAGTYNLLVTDSLGCKQTFNTVITQPSEIKITDTTVQISCFGANDGSIRISISGGVAPYIIDWSNFAKGDHLVDLNPGTYTVTITDANGCQAWKSILIKDTPYSINPVVKHVTCNGAQDGSIELNLVANNRKFTIAWDDNPFAGSTRNRLKPGNYTVRLTDSLCTVVKTYTIIEPLPISVASSITDAFSCNNPNSGSINLVVSGGTAPYTYFWSNGQNTKDITNIPAGTYIVSITDINGCQFSRQYEVKRQPVLTLTTNVVNDFNCTTGELKQICTAQASGGVAPYTYTWSSGTVSGVSNEIMETSKSGIYTLSVTDLYGCSTTYSFEVNIPMVGIDYLLVDCNNKIYRFDAHIPYGQASDYTFAWDFGDGQTNTSQNIEHKYATAGTYKVTLKLKNSTCETTFVRYVEIIAQPTLLLNKIPIICRGDSIMLHVSGADYYRWFNGATTDSILIKKSGDYSVEGTNIHGCSSILNFTVSNFDDFNFTILSNKEVVSTDDPYIQLWTQDMTNAEYLWDFGDGKTSNGAFQNHTYNITGDGYFDVNLQIKNPNGCIENAIKRIWIKNNILKNTFSPNGDTVDDIFMKGWHIKIYNRNGVLIYEGKEGWDGKYKGKDVSNDTYFVILYYPTSDGVKTNTGYITVIR